MAAAKIPTTRLPAIGIWMTKVTPETIPDHARECGLSSRADIDRVSFMASKTGAASGYRDACDGGEMTRLARAGLQYFMSIPILSCRPDTHE
jgi:hypothetical protein